MKKDRLKKYFGFGLFAFVFLFAMVQEINAYPVYVKPLTSGGNLQPNTVWNYTFNFTTDSSCNNVIFENISIITTGKDGIGFVDLDISSLSEKPSYLCVYKNDSLVLNELFSDQVFNDVWIDDTQTNTLLIKNDNANSLLVQDASGGNNADLLRVDTSGDEIYFGDYGLGVSPYTVFSKSSGSWSYTSNNIGDYIFNVWFLTNPCWRMEVSGKMIWRWGCTGNAVTLAMSNDSTLQVDGHLNVTGNIFSDNAIDLITDGNLCIQNPFVCVPIEDLVNGVFYDVNVTNELWANKYVAETGGQGFNLSTTSDDLIMQVDVTGNNYFSIETDGAFLSLYANPNPSVDYLMFTVSETQGADTEINFYEGGTGHNRFWNSGSSRSGGAPGSTCDVIDTKGLVDCNTPSTGADHVQEDEILAMGGFISGNDTTTNITDTGIIQFSNLTTLPSTDSHSLTVFDDKLCFFDNTRNMWLEITKQSRTVGRNSNSVAEYRSINGISMAVNGFFTNRTLIITGYDASNSINPAARFNVEVNGTELFDVVWNKQYQEDYTLNETIIANSVWRVNKDSPTSLETQYPIVTVYYREVCE